MKKIYYQCRFTQTAPLRLTSGEDDHTDSDLLLDGNGYPFIPGSALAGVLRSMLVDVKKEVVDTLFGIIEEKKNIIKESRLQVSDAVLYGDNRSKEQPNGIRLFDISARHGVRIDEDTGTAKNGAKFDYEVVEIISGHYTAVLELDVTNETADVTLVDTVRKLMGRIVANGISFGARTTRGYGSMSAKVFRREFNLNPDSTDRETWLAFDPFDEAGFGGEVVDRLPVANDATDLDIRAKLQMEGSFTVRVHSTDPEGPDSYPLKQANLEDGNADGDKKGKPVIPGTSWAGVFRHHMRSLARQAGLNDSVCKAVDELFGKIDDGNPKRSRIIFHEMAISEGKEMTVVRNALDRFTMAPRDKALFTVAVWQGGTGELRIQVRDGLEEPLCSLLYAALADLHFGLLTVGGEGSVGRGRASIESLTINGEEWRVTEENGLMPAERGTKA